jgi:hypothetical protein
MDMKKLLLICLIIFQGCIVTKPKVENAAYMVATFSHANFLSTCVVCHETKRPVSAVHSGSTDCAVCHRPPSWLYSHNPMPTSCLTCHAAKRPAVAKHLDVNGATITPTDHYSSQDCVKCHTPNTAWVFKHSPLPTSCNNCHSYKRPATVSGRAHDQTTTDCINCHTINTWQAFGHSPKPTSCNSCHAGVRPATNKSHNKDLRNHYNSRDCVYCHATPVVPYGNNWNSGAKMNCGVCH